MIRVLLSAWDRLSIYLPIAVMALMALATYWLVQNAPKSGTPAVERPARKEPDYFMNTFSVTTYGETGGVRSEVFGASARHFPASDMLEVDRIRVRSFDALGRLTTASADRALTNSDATVVELFGHALLVRESMRDPAGRVSPRIEFRGEYLHADTNTERVKSDRPVELRRGIDVFTADAMEFDNATQVMVMQGRVRGLIMPVKPR